MEYLILNFGIEDVEAWLDRLFTIALVLAMLSFIVQAVVSLGHEFNLRPLASCFLFAVITISSGLLMNRTEHESQRLSEMSVPQLVVSRETRTLEDRICSFERTTKTWRIEGITIKQEFEDGDYLCKSR